MASLHLAKLPWEHVEAFLLYLNMLDSFLQEAQYPHQFQARNSTGER